MWNEVILLFLMWRVERKGLRVEILWERFRSSLKIRSFFIFNEISLF